MNVLDTFQLQGRRALITGSSAGIGLALAEALAQAGAHVILNGRTASKVDAAAHALQAQGLSVSTAVFDVTDADRVRAAVEQIDHSSRRFIARIPRSSHRGRSGRIHWRRLGQGGLGWQSQWTTGGRQFQHVGQRQPGHRDRQGP